MGYCNRPTPVLAAVGLLLPTLCFGQAGVQNIVVTSAASFQLGLPPPGSIGTIFCTGLNVSGLVTAASVPLPYALAGVTVTIGGAAAPLFAVAELQSYQQINFQVPYDSVYGDGQAGVYAVTLVQQNGLQGSANATVSISPGDFFQIAGQYGIFQHSKDYSLVTKDNPAKPGETLVTYLTGVVPALDFSVPAGQPAPLSPVDRVTQFGGTYNIVLNGEPIGDVGDPDAIPFFGLAPGMLGVYQINFALPSSATSGDAQIKLRLTTPAFHGVSFVTYDSYPVLFPVR